MRRMIDFIREFKFGRPQQIAALLLVAFIVLCLFLPFDSTSTALYSNGRTRFWWPSPLQDGFRLVWTISRPALEIGNWLQTRINPRFGTDPSENGFWVDNTLRMPFLIFGVSLAGAIWWVSRRLYDNAGGYVALSLFSFSWWTILWTSSAYAEIIAAWGLYGMIYTSIGVAHTLYASPQKWRPRIVLLGLAFGFTLCAHFLAFAVGLILCTAFMLYLAPRRRTISVVVLATACLIAMTMLLVLHGWHFGSTLSHTLQSTTRSKNWQDTGRS